MTTLADDVELYGCMAEFVTPEELVEAARRTRGLAISRSKPTVHFRCMASTRRWDCGRVGSRGWRCSGACAEPSPQCCWSIIAQRSLTR